jgi:endonuclease-3
VEQIRKTGAIWARAPRVRGQIVRRVCEALEREYGRPRLGNPLAPLDDLVFIIISNKTSPQTARRIYRQVKERYASWNYVVDTPPTALESILGPAGLAHVKSQQIYAALQKVHQEFGSCDLGSLVGRRIDEVEGFLESLPGVSEKVAKCVMMYTMGAEVLPVDSHVHRIATRLGWTARKRADQCHAELEALIPPDRRYVFHVGCIMHGRSICRPRHPDCYNCCISRHCGQAVETREADD